MPLNDEPDTRQHFESADVTLTVGAPAVSRSRQLPDTIGRYRVLRLLGEGGMGAVYEAEQDRPRRTVALKLIKTPWASAETVQRFEREAQALGRLHHPGIAQIYEAGTVETVLGAQPFYAMELIDGKRLGAYAVSRGLDVRQRLTLTVQICEAVEHAHRCGIVHRDLKPANILVDEHGQPKILDFGLARFTDSDAEVTRQTDVGQLLGTLAYMSPEQVLGDPTLVDARSDVYALGVILHELLAGKLPYHISTHLPEAVQTIRETEPKRLSTVNTVYRGDIETIVAKALEKEKARRYSSAAQLGADIGRYLEDRPIEARPQTASYQAQKFYRRHKALAAGAAAVFLALSGGVVVSAWQAARARAAELMAVQQRDRALSAEQSARTERDNAVASEARAQRERDTALSERGRADAEAAAATTTSDFLQNDLLSQATTWQQSGGEPDPNITIRTALDRAAARVEKKFAHQPELEAGIRATLSTAYVGLGLYAEGEKHAERSVEIRRRVLGLEHPRTLESMTDLADALNMLGRNHEAAEVTISVLNARRRILGPEHPDTLRSALKLANCYYAEQRYAEQASLAARTLASMVRVLGPDDPDTLSGMSTLALAYDSLGKYAQGEDLHTRTIEARRRVLGPEHPQTLAALSNLGVLYYRQNKYADAETVYSTILAILRRTMGDEHPRTLTARNNLGALYISQGKGAEAAQLHLENLAIQRRVLGPEHPDTLLSMHNLGWANWVRGQPAEAEVLLTQTLEIGRRALGADHSTVAAALSNLGSIYAAEGKYVEAEPLVREALERRRRVLGPASAAALTSARLMAYVYFLLKKFENGEAVAREAVEINTKVRPDHWERFMAQVMLGANLAGLRKYADAEPLLLEGYKGILARMGTMGVPNHRFVKLAAEWIVRLYEDWGKPDKAAEWRQKVLATSIAPVPAR